MALPPAVSAPKAMALNRGLSSAVTSWNPATASDTSTAAGRMAHHVLGDSIADVIPEIKPLNQRVQSLMPVIQRGTAADLNAGFTQRIAGRFGAHTGALTGALAGWHYGGLPGAAVGLALPELLASPEGGMAMARAAYSPFFRNGLPPLIATGLQEDRDDPAKK
ncbi:MAG: hypothetical protein H0X25_22595 [Acidobacteriales bacterium]|nr:hypothetical protein [Terriglobales bacterium]